MSSSRSLHVGVATGRERTCTARVVVGADDVMKLRSPGDDHYGPQADAVLGVPLLAVPQVPEPQSFQLRTKYQKPVPGAGVAASFAPVVWM